MILFQDELDECNDAEIEVDETVEGVKRSDDICVDQSPLKEKSSPVTATEGESSSPPQPHGSSTSREAVPKPTTTSASKFNIRKALTLSREDLNHSDLSEKTSTTAASALTVSGDQNQNQAEPRRKLEMRQYLGEQ